MYHQLIDPSQPLLVDVMCKGLPTEQRENSKLKLLLTDNGCVHFGPSERLFFIVSVVLCLPSILQYDIRSKQVIIREVL